MSSLTLRSGARALFTVRTVLGVAAYVLPDAVAQPWVGMASRPAGPVLGRALGARDVALGVGGLLAGDDGPRLERWVQMGAVADAGDLLATLISFPKLPRAGRWLVLASTAGAVATAGVLLAEAER